MSTMQFNLIESDEDSILLSIAGHARLLASQDWETVLSVDACRARDQILHAIAEAADHVREQLAEQRHDQRTIMGLDDTETD